MRWNLLSVLCALALALGPFHEAWADNTGTSEGTSATGGADPVSSNSQSLGSTDANSTNQAVMSPFVSLENGLASSSDWTVMTLTEAATQVGMIMLIVVVAIVVLAAIGVGIYLTLRAPAAHAASFQRFLRYNERALHQQVVAGHGPVLVDFARLFAVEETYPAFAAVLHEHQREFREGLREERRGRFAADVLALVAKDTTVLAEWYQSGRLGIAIRATR